MGWAAIREGAARVVRVNNAVRAGAAAERRVETRAVARRGADAATPSAHFVKRPWASLKDAAAFGGANDGQRRNPGQHRGDKEAKIGHFDSSTFGAAGEFLGDAKTPERNSAVKHL